LIIELKILIVSFDMLLLKLTIGEGKRLWLILP